jgi:hypothetical protein
VHAEDFGGVISLRGSITAVIKERFSNAVTMLGGSVFESPGVGVVCPTTMLASGIDLNSLSAELGFHVEYRSDIFCGRAPGCWPPSTEDVSAHELTAVWDWDQGRFSSNLKLDAEINVEHFQRERRDRHDLYRVSGGFKEPQWIGTSRVTAISEGYRRARRQFLETKRGLLIRIPRDGYIPLPIASVGGLVSSSLVREENGWRYAYPSGTAILCALKEMFGDDFVAQQLSRDSRRKVESAALAVGRYRHRPYVSPGFARRT